MSTTFAAMNDTDLAAIEEAIRRERLGRQRAEDYKRIPLPSRKALTEALQYATEWLQPAYVYGDSFCMVHPHGHDCSAVAYPDGRVIFCHAMPLGKKEVKTLAELRGTWGPEGYERARMCLSECFEEYLWFHGTRMGRRQLKYATTPSGYPWARDRSVPNRIWRRHYGEVRPISRHDFFRMDIPGARCLIWRQDGVRYGSPYVLMAWETSPVEGMGIKAKKRRLKRESTDYSVSTNPCKDRVREE